MKAIGAPRATLGAEAVPIVRVGVRGGCELWAKREDLLEVNGFGLKVRKVRAVFGHARDLGVTDVLLDGCDDSACCAAAAMLGRDFGLRVHIFIRAVRPAWPGRRLQQTLATATSVTFVGGSSDAEAEKAGTAERVRSAGGRPLSLPTGLTTPESLDAGLESGAEIAAFEDGTGVRFDAVFVPVGTGGTAFSLEVARLILERAWRVVGICVDDHEPTAYAPGFEALYEQARRLRFPQLPDRLGGPELVWPLGHCGYRIPSAVANLEAARAVSAHGLLLDPTYMAKAWAGALEWLALRPGVRRGLVVVTGGSS